MSETEERVPARVVPLDVGERQRHASPSDCYASDVARIRATITSQMQPPTNGARPITPKQLLGSRYIRPIDSATSKAAARTAPPMLRRARRRTKRPKKN